MINKIILLGRVGKDPEIKQFENGSIANFTMATDDSYKDKSGQKVERTDWHNITIGTAGLVDVAARFVKKGDLLYIEGKVKTREYEKEGQKRYITEVRVDTLRLMPKGGNIVENTPQDQNPEQKISQPPTTTPPPADFTTTPASMDDDLPF